MTSESFGDGLVIVKANPADFDEILKFISDDFCKNEPLTNALEAKPQEMDALFRDLVNLSLADPCFTYLVKSTETGEIAALRMTSVLTRPSEPHSDEVPEYPSPKANDIAKLLGELEQKAWEKLPDAKILATWIILSVHEKFTRRGVARSMLEYRLEELKVAGCDGIITEATAFKSQQLFKKLGYQTLHEVLHCEYKRNNQQIFKCLDSTDRAILCYKPL